MANATNNALTVQYEVMGEPVRLSADFVKRYLVRGRADLLSDQEVLFYMNMCKMQRLNPLSGAECYLIKYSQNEPAQMVVGKAAYMRRAYENRDYICKEDGIIVQRGGDIVQKEGCCVYPGEKLVGGWCRVHYMRHGVERTAYKEVALSEYDKGQSSWKSKPATMLSKVAISQCIREAFPRDYEGLYSEDEMVASGAIPAEYTEVQPTERVVSSAEGVTISSKQKAELVKFIKDHFGIEMGPAILQEICKKRKLNSPDIILASDYDSIIAELTERYQEMNSLKEEEDVVEEAPEGFEMPAGDYMEPTEDEPPFV